MTTQLQLLTREINALEDHLISVIDAPLEYRPCHRPSRFYKKIKSEHKKILADLQILKIENTEDLENLSDKKQEIQFY
ncbi:hypothetical protein HispidOSU_027568, partial [Sigmodon hispidus]